MERLLLSETWSYKELLFLDQGLGRGSSGVVSSGTHKGPGTGPGPTPTVCGVRRGRWVGPVVLGVVRGVQT